VIYFRKKIKLQVGLKNSSIAPETIDYYQKARKNAGLNDDTDSQKTMDIVFSPRLPLTKFTVLI
jgi:hypothetical protein